MSVYPTERLGLGNFICSEGRTAFSETEVTLDRK